MLFSRRAGVACFLVLGLSAVSARAQDARALVQRAVDTEIAASRNDHTPWIYKQVDKQPGNSVVQWVAETHQGDIKRVLIRNGRHIPRGEQEETVRAFVGDGAAQSRQRKNNDHDDRQAEDMMHLLPQAFLWKITHTSGNTVTLHFEPDPAYKPPTYESRVFAAMAGDMTIQKQQHRIAALKGTLTRDVVFGLGMFGRLRAGGYFALKREELQPNKWQITETHVHVQGRALMFKTISEEEDDIHSDFQMEPEDVTLQKAAAAVMAKPE